MADAFLDLGIDHLDLEAKLRLQLVQARINLFEPCAPIVARVRQARRSLPRGRVSSVR